MQIVYMLSTAAVYLPVNYQERNTSTGYYLPSMVRAETLEYLCPLRSAILHYILRLHLKNGIYITGQCVCYHVTDLKT